MVRVGKKKKSKKQTMSNYAPAMCLNESVLQVYHLQNEKVAKNWFNQVEGRKDGQSITEVKCHCA